MRHQTPRALPRAPKTYRVNLRLEPWLGAELERLCQAHGNGALGPTTFAAQLLREKLFALGAHPPKPRP